MLQGLSILLVAQLAGEAVARGLDLPVPGPVIGLVLLAGGLLVMAARPGIDIEKFGVVRASGHLIAMLGLLFVPAGVGVVQQMHLVGQYGWAIIATLVLTTLVTMLTTVATFLGVKRLLGASGQ